MKSLWTKTLLVSAIVLVASSRTHADVFDPTNATMDELFFHAQQYASTDEKRASKEPARQELFARGEESLRYLMERVHIRNLWINILARQVVLEIEEEDAVPVLFESLESDRVEARRLAMYFLGYFELPDEAGRIIPFLDDEDVAASTIRTLGKWKVENAVDHVVPFLSDEKERRRVIAANALRDIGNPEAIPHLIAALGDRVFTVRNTASRALVAFGNDAEKPLIRHLREAEGPSLRQTIRTLGDLQSKKACRPLRKMLKHEDPGVRQDVKDALLAISPDRALQWISGRKRSFSLGFSLGASL